MINQLADKARKKMDDTLGSLKRDLDSISTGRASPNLLDTVRVEVYGQFMPISQLANVSVPEATTLSIQVWDRENVRAVEKAITNSNLGFNPAVDGTLLRISIPKLSEERRRDLVKLAKKYGEDKKIALRNIRRDANKALEKTTKDLSLSEDDEKKATEKVQNLLKRYEVSIQEMADKKAKEIMET